MITVVIPVFNGEKYIQETVESVILQTYKDWELIVINDGSTDKTREIVEDLCKKDSRIKIITKKNEGVSAARNTGFQNSKGEFLAFLDADDKWHKDNLFQKLNLLQAHKEIGLVHADMQFIDENSRIQHECYSGKEGNILKSLLLWDGTNIPSPSSILVRKEVIETVGLFDTDLSTAADQEFFFRVASKYKVARIPRVLGFYRFHSTNMHKNIALMERDHHMAFLKAKENNLFYSKWFRKKCFSNLFLIIGASWWTTNKLKSIKWMIKAFIECPLNIFVAIKKIFLKIALFFSWERIVMGLKYSAYLLMKAIGVLVFLRMINKKTNIKVLLFHRISDEKSLSWSPITPIMFGKIIKYLKHHYNIVSLEDALVNGPSTRPRLVITFDDGYKDFYQNALPVLKKNNLPALVNIVTNTINSDIPIWSQRINDLIEVYNNSDYLLQFSLNGNNFIYKINKSNIIKVSRHIFNVFLKINESERNIILSEMEENCPKIIVRTEFLNKNEIIEASHQKITFGNHSASHCNFNDLLTKEDYDFELLKSNIILEEITGKKNDIFAFPNGIFNNESLKMIENYGFNKILIVGEATFSPDNSLNTHLVQRKSIYYKSILENQFKIEGFHTLIKKILN